MNFDFNALDKKFQEAQEFLRQEYLQISTGRANPTLLDAISFDSYGSMQPIKNVASISIEDPRTLRVAPWDASQVPAIEKAIRDSQLPFSISSDESGVRVHIPQLTEESKASMLKLLKEKLESARVKIRNIRQEGMSEIDSGEANGDYAEDDKSRFRDELQKKVDAANQSLEDTYKRKEIDIMSV